MRRLPKRAGAGFALIELLVCIGVVGLIGSMSGMYYAEAIRLRGARERYRQRLCAAEFALERFVRDVRPGVAFGEAEGAYRAGPDTLLINRRDGVVGYRVVKAGLERFVMRAGQTRTELLIPANTLEMRFDYDTPSPGAARSAMLTLAWKEPPKIGISRPMLTRRAALRNAVRKEVRP